MKNRSFWIAVVPAGLIALTLAAEPKSFELRPRAIDSLDLKLLDRMETRLSQQLHAAGLRIQECADPDVVEGRYVAGYHGRNDPWNDVLQISRPDNPLITGACRDRVLDRVLDNAADRMATARHLRLQTEIWQQVREGARHLRLSEILLHLADCREGCSAYLSGILSCHIGGVRREPRTIVYFDAGRPRVYEERYYTFSRRDERRIHELAREVLAAGKDVILFARAAGAGAFDRHNTSGGNALAWRRARVVDNLLIAAGVPRDRIRWTILSWEPPRLATSDVARGYGFLDDWLSMTNKQDMDRSVVLVAH